jgi:hypothetical protein
LLTSSNKALTAVLGRLLILAGAKALAAAKKAKRKVIDFIMVENSVCLFLSQRNCETWVVSTGVSSLHPSPAFRHAYFKGPICCSYTNRRFSQVEQNTSVGSRKSHLQFLVRATSLVQTSDVAMSSEHGELSSVTFRLGRTVMSPCDRPTGAMILDS